MKVQVPSSDELHQITHEVWKAQSEFAKAHPVFGDLYAFVLAGIEWANKQLASPPPTKRPFLTDGEIEDEVKDFDYAEDRELYRTAARWARDKYEARDGGDVGRIAPTPKKVLRPAWEILRWAQEHKAVRIVDGSILISANGYGYELVKLMDENTHASYYNCAPDEWFTTEESKR